MQYVKSRGRRIVREWLESYEYKCSDCNGRGFIILNPYWPSGNDPHTELCGSCAGMGTNKKEI